MLGTAVQRSRRDWRSQPKLISDLFQGARVVIVAETKRHKCLQALVEPQPILPRQKIAKF